MSRFFRNPVIPGFHPDPSICRVGDDYYIATSSFGYFPGVPIHHSRDLVNWRLIGHALEGEGHLSQPGQDEAPDIWAPTLRYHDGLFYLVTTNMKHGGNFYVTASDAAGPWSEPIWFDKDGWDPSLFFDDDGTAYISRSGHHRDAAGNIQESVVQYTIDIQTGERTSEPRVVWEGTGGFGAEAPHLYKIDGRYYLLIAEGSTHIGHMATIARSDSPDGPFEPCPYNPVLTQRHRLMDTILAAGHADFVQAQDGSWWAVFLGIRSFTGPVHPRHHLGRETFLAPVTWTEDGWPLVNNRQPIKTSMPAPAWELHPWPQPTARDDFDRTELNLEWTFQVHPDGVPHSLTERPGWLRLKPPTKPTNEKASLPTWVGRRQQHTDCEVTTLLDFEPQEEGEEAGLRVHSTRHYHLDLAVRRENNERRLIVRRVAGNWSSVVVNKPLSPGPITLHLKADPWTYHLYFAQGDAELIHLEDSSVNFLTSEIAGTFTGVFLALYAETSTANADFDWFEYVPGQERD